MNLALKTTTFKVVLGICLMVGVTITVLRIRSGDMSDTESVSVASKQARPIRPPSASPHSGTQAPVVNNTRGNVAAAGVGDELLAQAVTGDLAAQSNLCRTYTDTGDVSGDHSGAAYWCSVAGRAGDAQSQRLYAQLFQRGAGVPRDDQEALSWYEKAAQQQDSAALYMLGKMLLDKGTPADNARGISLLQHSAALGNTRAAAALHRVGETDPERQKRNRATLIR